MRYGKIETGFWQSQKVKSLSEQARYLLLYLLSCPHGNLVGCFVLHDGYIAADLGWPIERVSHTLSEVFSAGCVERDPQTMLLRVTGWWGHNTLENPKVAKHAVKIIDGLPNCQVKQSLIASLCCFEERSSAIWDTLSKAYRKGMANPIDNQNHSIPEPNHSIPEPNLRAGAPGENFCFAGSVIQTGEPMPDEIPVFGPPSVTTDPAEKTVDAADIGPPPFGPSVQSAEERYWELVDDLEKRGVARSMCGRLLKSYQDFEASRRCLEAAAKAKDPSRYIGKAISNMREEAKHDQIGDPKSIPKDWPEPIKQIVRLGGHVSYLRQNRWRHGASIVDERGNVVGM